MDIAERAGTLDNGPRGGLPGSESRLNAFFSFHACPNQTRTSALPFERDLGDFSNGLLTDVVASRSIASELTTASCTAK